MRRLVLVLILLFAPAAVVPLERAHAEELTLSTPVSRGTRSTWTLIQIHINYDLPEVTMVFRDPSNGDVHSCVEPPATAASFIRTFNTADLTDNSLQKRMFTQAQTMACIGAGTVGGDPY